MLDVNPDGITAIVSDEGFRRIVKRQQEDGGADDDAQKVVIRRAMERPDTNMEAGAAHANSTTDGTSTPGEQQRPAIQKQLDTFGPTGDDRAMLIVTHGQSPMKKQLHGITGCG